MLGVRASKALSGLAGRGTRYMAGVTASSGSSALWKQSRTPPYVQRAAAVCPAWASCGTVRAFGTSGGLRHGHGHSHDHDGPTVKVTFVYEKDGSTKTVDGAVGMSVLRVAHAHEVDLEGACEASLACSTCHVVLEQDLFDKLEEPSDDENDMLDLAFGLTETSRLGCQVFLTDDMDGAVFKIPSATRNMYVDGHVPKPH